MRTHGVSGYQRGCRCESCKKAMSEYSRKYYHKNKLICKKYGKVSNDPNYKTKIATQIRQLISEYKDGLTAKQIELILSEHNKRTIRAYLTYLKKDNLISNETKKDCEITGRRMSVYKLTDDL